MSQMPPYLRAYRQALRDVQHALLDYYETTSGSTSTQSAISSAADLISMPLRQLRERGSASLSLADREEMSVCLAEKVALVRGYQAGFREALDIVSDRGRQMRNPAAREAIEEALVDLLTNKRVENNRKSARQP